AVASCGDTVCPDDDAVSRLEPARLPRLECPPRGKVRRLERIEREAPGGNRLLRRQQQEHRRQRLAQRLGRGPRRDAPALFGFFAERLWRAPEQRLRRVVVDV